MICHQLQNPLLSAQFPPPVLPWPLQPCEAQASWKLASALRHLHLMTNGPSQRALLGLPTSEPRKPS